jgi:hypothetical protein
MHNQPTTKSVNLIHVRGFWLVETAARLRLVDRYLGLAHSSAHFVHFGALPCANPNYRSVVLANQGYRKLYRKIIIRSFMESSCEAPIIRLVQKWLVRRKRKRDRVHLVLCRERPSSLGPLPSALSADAELWFYNPWREVLLWVCNMHTNNFNFSASKNSSNIYSTDFNTWRFEEHLHEQFQHISLE